MASRTKTTLYDGAATRLVSGRCLDVGDYVHHNGAWWMIINVGHAKAEAVSPVSGALAVLASALDYRVAKEVVITVTPA